VLLSIGSIPVAKATTVSLSAPTIFYEAALKYSFMFWDADASVGSTPALTFKTPNDDSTFAVDAWFIESNGGNGSPGVTTWAFSLNQDKTVSNTPIASVTPSGAWSGSPSTTVSTTSSSSPVAITASSLIAGDGVFNSWLQFGTGSISKNVLTVPAKGSSLAIAFFGIPVPDPCLSIRNQLANLNPSDFPNLAAYKAALMALGKELQICEEKWGESVTPLPPS
jgi:hypothetical protein